MTERPFHLVDMQGRRVSEVAARHLAEASTKAEDLGYTVIDTLEPDAVIVRDGSEGPVLQLVVWPNGTGSCGGNGMLSKEQAAGVLRNIANFLETGETPEGGVYRMPGVN